MDLNATNIIDKYNSLVASLIRRHGRKDQVKLWFQSKLASLKYESGKYEAFSTTASYLLTLLLHSSGSQDLSYRAEFYKVLFNKFPAGVRDSALRNLSTDETHSQIVQAFHSLDEFAEYFAQLGFEEFDSVMRSTTTVSFVTGLDKSSGRDKLNSIEVQKPRVHTPSPPTRLTPNAKLPKLVQSCKLIREGTAYLLFGVKDLFNNIGR